MTARRVPKLDLDPVTVRKARSLARRAGRPIVRLAEQHTTVSVERATLRLAGLTGADVDGIPWVNRLLDAVRGDVGLEHGAALPVWDALVRGDAAGAADLSTLAQKAAAGSVRFRVPERRDATRARTAARKAVGAGVRQLDRRRRERDRLVRRWGDAPRKPWIYLIVATGDIYEDIPQAQNAARAGADIIAVIRSTGQSLLDYVPEGATREGYAGTYATQENFRLMREALDETSAELGRYVRLTNYASGLCMPEIAALAGMQRLDMMLNDSMYGILFRDINPVRTFVDQRFSRQVHARAGIIINTGEDNYLTTADAVEAAHTVTVSQLLNEYFAKEAGLEDWQLGLGHAFEIDPAVPESFRMELAHALLARQLFPKAPLKWMPPTRHMTGDVFRGYLLDGFFNLAGVMTGQDILLVGMMTEAVVTPWLSDRDLALQNVRYVVDAAGRLHEDFRPSPDGFIAERARQVLAEAVDLLEQILAHPGKAGLLEAIADGTFGMMKRPADGGKGLDGVARKAPGYENPAADLLDATVASGSGGAMARGTADTRRDKR
ncbi:MAG TPA: lysine 5,6-aminomutase subunit alpha [Nocardioidaceae bacterium]|nr:lysine 5,6-aminomutase subunit alpha [Nocardioidaceae bacterium]